MRVSYQCGFNLVVLGITLLALTGCERQRSSREQQLLLEALKEQRATVAQIEEHRQLLATEKEEIKSQRGQLDNEQKRLREERKAIESERRKNEAALASLAATEKRNQELLGKIAAEQSRLDAAFAEMDRLRKVNELRAPFAAGLVTVFNDTWGLWEYSGKILNSDSYLMTSRQLAEAIAQSGAWLAKSDDEFRKIAVDACIRWCVSESRKYSEQGNRWSEWARPISQRGPKRSVAELRKFLLKKEHVELTQMGILELPDELVAGMLTVEEKATMKAAEKAKMDAEKAAEETKMAAKMAAEKAKMDAEEAESRERKRLEDGRKEVFYELAAARRESEVQADTKWSVSKLADRKWPDWHEHHAMLLLTKKLEIGKRYKLDLKQLASIESEGFKKNWTRSPVPAGVAREKGQSP